MSFCQRRLTLVRPDQNAMLVRLILDVSAIPLTAWFWWHCARPVLVYDRAGMRTYRLVLGVTTLAIAGYAGQALAAICGVRFSFGSPVWLTFLIVGGLWIAVVGLGWMNGYRLLGRLLGEG